MRPSQSYNGFISRSKGIPKNFIHNFQLFLEMGEPKEVRVCFEPFKLIQYDMHLV